MSEANVEVENIENEIMSAPLVQETIKEKPIIQYFGRRKIYSSYEKKS